MGLGKKVRSVSSDMKDKVMDARMDSLTRANDELKVENELLREELDGDRKTRDRMMSLLDRLDVEARPKRRIGLFRLVVIGGAAYVLGAKAGRQRYDQIRAWWQKGMDRTSDMTQSWSNGSKGSVGSDIEQHVGQGI
jgi:hypothetical protein